MKMDSDDAVITSTGNANLPTWYIDTTHSITLKSVPDMKPLKATIKGPINRPINLLGNLSRTSTQINRQCYLPLILND